MLWLLAPLNELSIYGVVTDTEISIIDKGNWAVIKLTSYMHDINGVNMFNKFNSIYEHIMSLTMKNKVEASFYIMHNVDW